MAAADPRYVAARRVLLDALEALAPHGPAIIVAGAQAVYLRTGATDIGVAPYTTDGDLALDPTLLGAEPELAAAMKAAHFHLNVQEPGIWLANTVIDGDELTIPVDLIVPEGAATGGGRRGARLGRHGNRAARRAVGLEAVLLDHSTMAVTALEPGDTRSFATEVAGQAALFVAKAHKIHDRLASPRPGRAADKDASDVYRLMQTTEPSAIGQRLAQLRRDEMAGPATGAAVIYLAELFGSRAGIGIAMASRALQLAIPEAQVTALSLSYMERLLATLDQHGDPS